MELFGSKCNIVQLKNGGIQQRRNTKTVTKAILSTSQLTAVPPRWLNVHPDGCVS